MTTKRRLIKHLPLMLAGLSMGLGVFSCTHSLKNNETVESDAITNRASDASTYYNSITASSGTALLGQLHDLSVEKHTTYNSYSDNSTTNCFKTDRYQSTSYIMDFYSGAPTSNSIESSGTSGWNREHVWCQDLSNGLYGKDGAGADIQHIRPTIPKLNSDRGNKKYGELNNSGTASTATDANNNAVHGGYYSGNTFQPMDNKKGDVARIVMYLYMHYNKASNVGGTKDGTNSSYFGTLYFTHVMAANSEAAAIQLLLSWNTSDPVDSIETTRNNEAANITGCRNPFIDHPEYANSIWGSSSSDPSATISPASPSVAVGSTVNLTATLSNVTSASSISWTSNDTSKATVAKGTTTSTSSSATVTGVAAGTTTIYCKYNDTNIGSVNVTVTSSGGSGSSSEDIIDNAATSSNLGNTSTSSWGTDFSINGASGAKYTIHSMGTKDTSNALQWNTNGYLYSTVSGGTIIGVSAVMTSGKSINVYGSNSAFSGNSGGTQIGSITGSDSLTTNAGYTYILIKGATAGNAITSITIQYSSSQVTLSSISVSTAPTKISYTAGQYFDPTGLVIRRNYSNNTNDTYTYANHTSEFTFNPTTSTALTISHTSVTITYGGKNCDQAITVTAAPVTSITASVSKTFYVGETITSSDITVKDNNNNTILSFTFNDDGYQFKYADAASGGGLTNKTFSNTITYSNKTCSLTVQVQRKAYSNSSTTTLSVTYTDLPTAYSTSTSERTAASGIKFVAYNLANYSSKMQFKASGGYLETTEKMNLVSVTLNDRESNTLTVYGNNTAGSFSTTISGSNDTYNLSGYKYVKIIRSASGVAYCSSISFTISAESPTNVANYIMYTDTEGQCSTKLTTAVGYIKNLFGTDKTTFQTSNDYVISTARTRLEAWARNQEKTINYSTGTLSNASRSVPIGNSESNSSIIVVVVLSMMAIAAIGGYIYIYTKRY